jgi:segregation and condensation protein A
MDSQVDINPTYKVMTAVYEGPLDLLLQLIEREELDITKLALAEVTDQYLEHIKCIPQSLASEVSSFLVIATKLIQIKSEVLLPRPPTREPGEEDPGDALARQLMIYKRFKEIANFLMNRDHLGLRSYPRLSPSPRPEARLDFSSITIDDLIKAAQEALSKLDDRPELGSLVTPPRITIREKINLIKNFIRRHQKGTFQNLITGNLFRLEIVITFLALLELVKRKMITTRQTEIFGPIEFESGESWQEDAAFELEFGE